MSMLATYAGIVLQLGGVIVLSRLLTPAEVGIYSIAAAFAAIAGVVRDFGVGEYLIQCRDLDERRIRAAFTVNIAVSWAVAALIWLSKDTVGAYFGEPGISRVLGVLAANFVIIPFGAVTMAYLRRQLRMGALLASSVLATTASTAVSITLALRGWSYMAIAWGSLAGVLVSVLVALWFRPSGFPRFPGIGGWVEVTRLGFNLSLAYIVGALGKNLPDLIIGRAQSAATVALFSRANGLLDVFSYGVVAPVENVAMAHYAARDRAGENPVAAFYETIEYLTGAGWLFCAAVVAGSYVMVALLYGSQWLAAAPVASLLALSFALNVTFSMSREFLIARGATPSATKLQLASQCARVLACAIAAPHGLAAVAVALAVASIAGFWINCVFLRRVGVELAAVLRACRKSAVAALICLPTWALTAWVLESTTASLATQAIVFGTSVLAVTLVALALTRHPLTRELKVLVASVAAARGRPRST